MVKPFPVDEAILSRIRPMQNRDAADAARLHQAAMGDSLWARLGRAFLTELYRGLIDSPQFLGFVYEEPADAPPGRPRVRGFIAGTTDGDEMMRGVFRSRFATLGATAALGLLRSPGALRPLLQTARYFRVSGVEGDAIPAESLFCSFERDLRGRRIAGHINKVLFDDLLARGHRFVKITTETDNTGANRQLRSWGFEQRGTFQFYDKEMVRYVLDLEGSPRVEPVSRHPTI